MSKRSKRKNTRQSDFEVVVRGVRRATPDYSRLMQATLKHFHALHHRTAAEATPHGDDQRPSATEDRP